MILIIVAFGREFLEEKGRQLASRQANHQAPQVALKQNKIKKNDVPTEESIFGLEEDSIKVLDSKAPPIDANEARTEYIWRVHENYGGIHGRIAIEVRPRSGEVMFWRFAIPESAKMESWGYGPTGGEGFTSILSQVVEGHAKTFDGIPISIFGAGDRITTDISAYVAFKETVPDFVMFGKSQRPFALTGEKWEILQFELIDEKTQN